VYTGKTKQPCCLCDDPDTTSRLDLPPRAITHMKHADAIAWQDVVGEVSIHFCESDWQLVSELVLDMGLNPLSRCNVARASFDLREDFEAMLSRTRNQPDQERIERKMNEKSTPVLTNEAEHERRARVEAHLIRWVIEEPRPNGAC
jgi:hypothetical protein